MLDSILLATAAINASIATHNLIGEDVKQYVETKRTAKKCEKEYKKSEEARKRMELYTGEKLIHQGEAELKKLNIEKLGFKLDTTALTYTDAITYFIHDIKTGKKRWMMLSQIKEMIENNQRIQ